MKEQESDTRKLTIEINLEGQSSFLLEEGESALILFLLLSNALDGTWEDFIAFRLLYDIHRGYNSTTRAQRLGIATKTEARWRKKYLDESYW